MRRLKLVKSESQSTFFWGPEETYVRRTHWMIESFFQPCHLSGNDKGLYLYDVCSFPHRVFQIGYLKTPGHYLILAVESGKTIVWNPFIHKVWITLSAVIWDSASIRWNERNRKNFRSWIFKDKKDLKFVLSQLFSRKNDIDWSNVTSGVGLAGFSTRVRYLRVTNSIPFEFYSAGRDHGANVCLQEGNDGLEGRSHC